MGSRVSAWRPAGGLARSALTLLAIVALALSAVAGLTLAIQPAPVGATHTYDNPLTPVVDENSVADTCADPSVIYDDETDLWYMYCTTDPLSEDDTVFHLIPMFSSPDLVNWTYEGDAFASPDANDSNFPEWAYPGGQFGNGDPHPRAGLWAPEIDFIDGTWYLYYVVTDMTDAANPMTDTEDCSNDNAIGVATADSPLGPWTDSGDPAVDPRPNGGTPTCNFFWTYDPEVFSAGETWYMYFGSYYGGIFSRPLVLEGQNGSGVYTETNPQSEVQITIANRYEGAEVIFSNGYYYLFVSAADCCRKDLTGYSVFAGRSTSPTGTYVDEQGISLLDARTGGARVLAQNGNGFVGVGHNTVFQDFAGQWWTIYHGIDVNDPELDTRTDINQRPALLDPLDWDPNTGFPEVRGGCWASNGPQPAPAAQPGHPAAYTPTYCGDVDLGRFELVEELSDEFDGDFGPQWSWVREPEATQADPSPYGIEDGQFRFNTQYADLHEDSNNAGMLLEPSPDGEYVVEIRVRTTVPVTGFQHNFRQAGVAIYGGDEGTAGDDDYVRLAHFSYWETRQIEFAKERNAEAAAGRPRFGGTVLGPPAEWTILRIHHWEVDGVEYYQSYSSTDANADGVPDFWHRGGVWTHDLGSRIGLFSLGAGGPCDDDCGETSQTTAFFDWIHVYALPDAPAPSINPTNPPSAPASGTARPAASRIPNTSAGQEGVLGTLLPLAAAAVLFGGSATWLAVERARARRRSQA